MNGASPQLERLRIMKSIVRPLGSGESATMGPRGILCSPDTRGASFVLVVKSAARLAVPGRCTSPILTEFIAPGILAAPPIFSLDSTRGFRDSSADQPL